MIRTLLLTLSLAGLALADDSKAAVDADAKARVDALKAAAKEKDSEPRAQAISSCGEVAHPLTAAAVAPFLGDPVEDVRLQAAKALGRMAGLAEAAKALHGGLRANEEKPKVLKEIFTAMGDVNSFSSVAVCKDWINGRITKRDTSDQTSINEAIACLGNLKFKASVTTLIDLGKKNIVANGARGGHGMRARSDVRFNRALQQLTAESFEDIDSWDDWWKKSAGKFNEDMTVR